MPKQPKIKLPSLKAIGKAVLAYREGRAAGTVSRSATMEKISPFFGKKGQVLKRETRYNTQKQRLLERVKAVKERYGSHPGKASFKRVRQQKDKQTGRAARTFAEKHVKQKKEGGADKRFKKQAKEKAVQFMNAAEVFGSDTYNSLIDGAYGIGSDVVIAMALSGLESEEIEEYLKQIKETFDDIPEEAQGLASNDAFWQSVKDLTDIIREGEGVDYKDIFSTYIKEDPDPEAFKEALENYVTYDGERTKSFSEVWDELKYYTDPGNADTLREIMEGEEDA